MMKKVKVSDILREKGSQVWSISPDASVYEALELIADKDIGALLVMQDNRVVGLITEREYARNVILKGRASRETPVRDVMLSEVAVARPEQPVDECMALMTDKRIRHLPVLENGELRGLVSIGDLVKSIIVEQKFVIDQLENYISG